MLIVEITLNYFSHGAVMRRARQETKALINAGHRVIVITDLRWKSAYKELIEYRNKLQVIPINPFYIHRPFRMVSSQLSFALKVYYTLKKLSKKEHIDLIVSHASTICYAVASFANKNRIPSAWVIQELIKDRMATGNPYNWFETLLLKHSDRYALRNMHYLMPVSNYTKTLAILDGAKPENTYVKYNAIDTQLQIFKKKRF